MRAVFAVACLLVIVAGAMPVSADNIHVRPYPHWRSMYTDGTATSIYQNAAEPVRFDVWDANAWFSTMSGEGGFPVTWTIQEAVPGQHNLFRVHVTGASQFGALDLQGVWQPTAGVAVCTLSLPGHCTAKAVGPIALTGQAGPYSLELAGTAFDVYSYSTAGPLCLVCEVREVVEQVGDIRT